MTNETLATTTTKQNYPQVLECAGVHSTAIAGVSRDPLPGISNIYDIWQLFFKFFTGRAGRRMPETFFTGLKK